jgi:hypothetical protein
MFGKVLSCEVVHNGLLENNCNKALQGIFLTRILGMYFTTIKDFQDIRFLTK